MSGTTKDHAAVEPTGESGLRDGMRVTWVGMAVNLLLVVFKIWAGIVARSQALVADGVHSVSDLFSDAVVLFGLKWGRKGADADHPYGHARIETISSMLVGLILLAVSIGIAYNAILSIYRHNVAQPSLLAVWAAVISIALKEGMYWYTIIVGRRLKSMALIANAWHHRSDALSSVAVLIGVGATFVNPEWHLADAIAALVVTIFVGRVGLQLAIAALRELSDTAPDREVLEQIRTFAGSFPGVRQVHDLKARYSGSQIFVELHIVVDPDQTVRDGHAIARQVKQSMLVEFADITHVIIHIDPEIKK